LQIAAGGAMIPLRSAVIGGGAGGRLSMSALAKSTVFELVAVADIRPEVCRILKEEYPGLRTFPDHQSLFAECPVDVICVSTYAPTHELVTLDALATLPLKGLLVEKPLGHTVASAHRLLKAIRERGLPVVVPHNLLTSPTSLAVIEKVRAGAIGELKLVEIQCKNWDIINAGIHWLNFFVVASGNDPVRSVHAAVDKSTRTYRDGMQVETLAVTTAITQSGIRVIMYTGDGTPINVEGKDFVFRLLGTQGTLEFYGWEPGYLWNQEWILPPSTGMSGHQRHLENLAAMIETGVPDYSVAESSLSALEIVEAAYLSGQYGCQVEFPLEHFVPPVPTDWEPGHPYSGVGGGRDGRKL